MHRVRRTCGLLGLIACLMSNLSPEFLAQDGLEDRAAASLCDRLRKLVKIPNAALPEGVALKPIGRGSPLSPVKSNPDIVVDRRAFPVVGLPFGMTDENALRDVGLCVVATYFEHRPQAEIGVYGLWFSSRVAAEAWSKKVRERSTRSSFIAKGNLLLAVWRDPGVSDAAMTAVVAYLSAAKLDVLAQGDTGARVTFKTGKPSSSCEGGVFAVAVSPDSRWIATGESDGASLWDVETGLRVRRYPNRGTVHAVRFSPDGKHLAWGGFGNSFAIVDLVRNKTVLEPDVGICVGFFTSYSADGKLLLSDGGGSRGNRSDEALLWDVRSTKLLQRFKVEGTLRCGVLAPNGETAITGDNRGRVIFWETATGRRLGEVRVHAPAVLDLAIDARGSTVAAVSSAPVPYVSIIDVSRRVEVRRIPRKQVIRAVALSGDGKLVAVAGNNHGIEIHDVATGECVQQLAGHQDGCSSLVFNSDATMLLSGGFDGYAVLWQLQSPSARKTAPTDGPQIMRRVAEVYAGCRTYSDHGTQWTVTLDAEGKVEREQRAVLSTAFVRQGGFRFEYETTRRGKPDRYVIWTDGRNIERHWQLKPGGEPPESLSSALSVATGVTMGASTVITNLLMKNKPWGVKPREWKRLDDESVGPVECFRVRNRFKAVNFDDASNFDVVETYWVGKKDFAVHRVQTEMSLPNMRSLTTITLTPKFDRDVSQEALRRNAGHK